jgi:hypothetical protein
MNTQILDRYLNIKIITSILVLFIVVSCADKKQVSYEELIGLYQITDRVCDVPEIEKSDCEQARFIELVKGRFYGVSDKEVAFVVWSGNTGEELLYQARKLDSGKRDIKADGEVIIVSNEYEKEYLTIQDRSIVEYKLLVSSPNGIKKIHRYTLRLISRDSVSDYKLEYPSEP